MKKRGLPCSVLTNKLLIANFPLATRLVLIGHRTVKYNVINSLIVLPVMLTEDELINKVVLNITHPEQTLT